MRNRAAISALDKGLSKSAVLLTFPNPRCSAVRTTSPVKVFTDVTKGSLPFTITFCNASLTALDSGLFSSDVLSTLPRLIESLAKCARI